MAETLDNYVDGYDLFFINLKNGVSPEIPQVEVGEIVKEATNDLVKYGVGGKSQLTYLNKYHELTDKLHKARATFDTQFNS